jgi:tellurite methyltransferase
MDLGSGTGRNSLLVARNGFCVTAVDNDPNKIAELKKRVDRENGIEGRIETLLADIATMDFAKETIDNALLSFVLRFQNDHDFYDIIDRIQNATTSGGLHIVQELTENGPLYDSRKPGHWPARNELLDLYKKAGWSILEHIVEIGPTAYPHPKGPKDRPAMHEAVALVARKPR